MLKKSIILCALLVGGRAPGDEPVNASAAPAATYEVGLRADQKALGDALHALNTRFRATLGMLHVEARDRGDLEETLAAKQLWERVAPLTTAAVFSADSPLSGSAIYALPEPPASRGKTGEAFSNYVAKVGALADQFNAVASNRQARYIALMDQLVRDLTRRGDLEQAVKTRDARSAAEQAGPLRLVVGSSPGALAQQRSPAASPFLGRWRFREGGAVIREFRPDGRVYHFSIDGIEMKSAPFRVLSANTAVAEGGDGWIDTYQLQPDGTITCTARSAALGLTFPLTGVREGAVAASPVVGVWVPANLPGYRIVAAPDGVLASLNDRGWWRYEPSSQTFFANWTTRAPQQYHLSPPSERLEEVGATNVWRRNATPGQRAQNRSTLPDEETLKRSLAGFWTRERGMDSDFYELTADGTVFFIDNSTQRKVRVAGRWYVMRDEGGGVALWADGSVYAWKLPLVDDQISYIGNRANGTLYRYRLPGLTPSAAPGAVGRWDWYQPAPNGQPPAGQLTLGAGGKTTGLGFLNGWSPRPDGRFQIYHQWDKYWVFELDPTRREARAVFLDEPGVLRESKVLRRVAP